MNAVFAGRVALVTGASGGIGARLAERLAGEGAAVALHYAHRAESVEELAQALLAAGAARTKTVGADFADPLAPDCGRRRGRVGARPDRRAVRQPRHGPPRALRGCRRGVVRPDDGGEPALAVPARAARPARDDRAGLRAH